MCLWYSVKGIQMILIYKYYYMYLNLIRVFDVLTGEIYYN